MTKKQKERIAKFAPNGIPRWVRCYDNGGETADRFTVIFTGRYRQKTFGEFLLLGMSNHPFHPQGIGMHDSYPYQCDAINGKWPPAIGRKNHLGTRVEFAALPDEVQQCVMQTYNDLWDLSE